MIRRKPALPRIEPASGLRCAQRQCAHRGRGDRPITHTADIDDGPGMERMLAITFANYLRRCRQPVTLQYRESDIDENDRARLTNVIGRAETDDAALVLRIPVYPGPGSPIKGHFVPIAGKEVLPQILPLFLQEKSQTPDNR